MSNLPRKVRMADEGMGRLLNAMLDEIHVLRDEAKAARGARARLLPVGTHSFSQQEIVDGFWAKLTSSATVGGTFRYAWKKQYKSTSGQAGFADHPDGFEELATGGDMAAFNLEDTLTAIPDDSYVWMWIIRPADRRTSPWVEYWFSTVLDIYVKAYVAGSVDCGPKDLLRLEGGELSHCLWQHGEFTEFHDSDSIVINNGDQLTVDVYININESGGHLVYRPGYGTTVIGNFMKVVLSKV